jgi:hypothetical protein
MLVRTCWIASVSDKLCHSSFSNQRKFASDNVTAYIPLLVWLPTQILYKVCLLGQILHAVVFCI